MKNIMEIPYRGAEHGSFEEEWLSRKGASEWWYATGVLHDESGTLYSYQVVLIKACLGIMTPWFTQLALTNFETGKHYYYEHKQRNDKGVTVNETTASHEGTLSIVKGAQRMTIIGNADVFSFELDCDYGKGAFWHCDNGLLKMGTETTKETTLYYSYPKMPTRGTITLDGKTLNVTGESWFDKQGGPYRLTEGDRHWEWFSLRFFDGEQIMLFSYPQHGYVDGTYIMADHAERLNHYTIQEEQIIEVDGLKYASGWTLNAPGVKQECYTIRPIMEGQRNGVYFEQLCDVLNADGEKVALCFVELLPGVRNKNFIGSMI